MGGWDEAIQWLQQIENRVGNGIPRTLKVGGLLLQNRVKELHGNSRFTSNSAITISGGWMRNKKSGKPLYIEGKGKNSPLLNSGSLQGGVTLDPIRRIGAFSAETKVYPKNLQVAVWMEYGTYATVARPAWLVGYQEGFNPATLVIDKAIGALIG